MELYKCGIEIYKWSARGDFFRPSKSYVFASNSLALEENTINEGLFTLWERYGYKGGANPSYVPPTLQNMRDIDTWSVIEANIAQERKKSI